VHVPLLSQRVAETPDPEQVHFEEVAVLVWQKPLAVPITVFGFPVHDPDAVQVYDTAPPTAHGDGGPPVPVTDTHSVLVVPAHVTLFGVQVWRVASNKLAVPLQAVPDHVVSTL
jgi:hypothetical protein